jgi:outer membrane translocation and assembly module TamA
VGVSDREFPEEDFFGLGTDSRRDDRTNFLYSDFRTEIRGGVELFKGLAAGGGVTFVSPGVGRGRDTAYPSTGDEFTEAEAPGLQSQPNFVLTSVYVDLNRVGNEESPRTGGAIRVGFTNATDRDSGAFSYRQWDVDLRHYFPFFQGKRLVFLRGWFVTSEVDEGKAVPFYQQPYLGGRKTLRGYDDQRFRGPHLLLLQAEYRFEVWPALDMALFADAGDVGERREDLRWSNFKSDYGVSFRFGGQTALFRVDLAFGGETRRFSVVFGDVF